MKTFLRKAYTNSFSVLFNMKGKHVESWQNILDLFKINKLLHLF